LVTGTHFSGIASGGVLTVENGASIVATLNLVGDCTRSGFAFAGSDLGGRPVWEAASKHGRARCRAGVQPVLEISQ